MGSFRKASEFISGAIFKPAENMTALAVLIEPHRLDRDQKNTLQNGDVQYRDEVTADITIFGTQEALDKGVPTSVTKNGRIVHKMLVQTAEKMIGEQGSFKVEKIPLKNGGSGYVFRDTDAGTTDKVVAYFDGREAAVEAALAGGAPSFN